MIRRNIDRTLASKDDDLIILALDWAKGISARITQVTKDIYRNKVFNVKWDSQALSFHAQHCGISQG